MKISVAIPLYNGREYINQSLDSVFAQTCSPHEVIVVEDGSTDSSPSIVRQYPGARLIENPKNGPNAARNHGIRETNSEAVAFLDQDDLWHPEHLQRLCRSLRENPESPAAFSRKTNFSDGEHPQYSTEASGSRLYNAWSDFPSNALGESLCALIRRDALKCVDGWSTRHVGCGDYHLWLKLALLGPLVVRSSVTAGHRIHGSSHADELRSKEPLRYYARHVDASRDALTWRQKEGLSIEPFRPRHKAQRALLDLFEAIMTEELPDQREAVRRFDRSVSEESRDTILSIWATFRWYIRPYAQCVGAQSFATKILDLVEQWPSSDSRFRDILRQWAFRRTPADELLRRYPLSSLCWSHLLDRSYRKVLGS